MQNPFIVVRFVFFALLVNLNLLMLAFASWNVHSIVAAEISVPATTIFLIFNSCTLFFCIALGLAELFAPQARTSHLLFECVWLFLLSLLQTGTAISLTIHGSTICRLTSDWDICASSSLLIPTAWLSSIILLTYLFALLITVMAHMHSHPHIWSTTVYSVNWFNQLEVSRVGTKEERTSDATTDSWSRYMDDIEASRNHLGSRAPWARNIRRGIDAPFTQREFSSSLRSSSPMSSPLPVVPLKVQPRNTTGSRFIEKFRESHVLSRSTSPLKHGMYSPSQVEPFPPRIDDHDLPIPLPRLSEWIRADAIKGINVHTIPNSP